MRGSFTFCVILACLVSLSASAATPEERNTGLAPELCDSISNTELVDCRCFCVEDFYFDHNVKRCVYETTNVIAVAKRGPLQSLPLEPCPVPATSVLPTDADADGYSTIWDCDDADKLRSPGLAEECTNAVDNDCDGAVSENDTDCGASPASNDPDGDGITGIDDYCPNKPETVNGYDDTDGCPEFDHDSDGIPTAYDKCPDVPGVASSDPNLNGCPAGTTVAPVSPTPAATATPAAASTPAATVASTSTPAAAATPVATSTAASSTPAATATIAKDTDYDGLVDTDDPCPNDPDCDDDGLDDRVDPCPEDNDCDDDGILDGDDLSPRSPETINGYKDDDGAPDTAPDRDGDGIWDGIDAEPDLAEDFDGFCDADGAPEDDCDGDGVADTAEEPGCELKVDCDDDAIKDDRDQCDTEPETRNRFEDDDGCPDEVEDIDGDGLTGFDEKCPEKAEDFDNFEDEDGCPDPDNDEDGICDKWVSEDPNLALHYEAICVDTDQCEFSAEDMNGYEDEDGCPEGLTGPKLAAAKARIKREEREAQQAERERQTKIDSLIWKNGVWQTSQYTGKNVDTDEDTVPDDLDTCPDDLEDLDLVDDFDGCRDWDVNGHIQSNYTPNSHSLNGIRIIDVNPQWFMDVRELNAETAPAEDGTNQPILDLTPEAMAILDDAVLTMKRYNITITVSGSCPKPDAEDFQRVDRELERRAHVLRDYMLERASAEGILDPREHILMDVNPRVGFRNETYELLFIPGT